MLVVVSSLRLVRYVPFVARVAQPFSGSLQALSHPGHTVS